MLEQAPAEPIFTVIGGGEPTDAAIAAMARLLLALVEQEESEESAWVNLPMRS